VIRREWKKGKRTVLKKKQGGGVWQTSRWRGHLRQIERGKKKVTFGGGRYGLNPSGMFVGGTTKTAAASTRLRKIGGGVFSTKVLGINKKDWIRSSLGLRKKKCGSGTAKARKSGKAWEEGGLRY